LPLLVATFKNNNEWVFKNNENLKVPLFHAKLVPNIPRPLQTISGLSEEDVVARRPVSAKTFILYPYNKVLSR